MRTCRGRMQKEEEEDDDEDEEEEERVASGKARASFRAGYVAVANTIRPF